MLETLAELPKKVDEDIHRGYSRLTKKWEDKYRPYNARSSAVVQNRHNLKISIR